MKLSDLIFAVKLNHMSYGECHKLQLKLRNAVIHQKIPQTLLLVEHPPVITLGRRARDENLLINKAALQNKGVEVVEVERGGDVTYHGPGQMVAYPIFHIGSAVRMHVENLAQAGALTCRDYGVTPHWDKTRPGLWVHGRKIAAIGVHIHKGVSIHGMALNVSGPLEGFQWIVPCGLHDTAITTLEQEAESKEPPEMDGVMDLFKKNLTETTTSPPFTFLPQLELFSYLEETNNQKTT